jgi:hypothetical protein
MWVLGCRLDGLLEFISSNDIVTCVLTLIVRGFKEVYGWLVIKRTYKVIRYVYR